MNQAANFTVFNGCRKSGMALAYRYFERMNVVMKTVLKIIFLGVLTVLLTMAAMAHEPVVKAKPTNDKDRNLFVFKAEKKMIGAKVEIIQLNGGLIAEQILQTRKLVIDFDEMKSGTYIIRVVKGTQVKEFNYTR
jgi:hypothetical protein